MRLASAYRRYLVRVLPWSPGVAFMGAGLILVISEDSWPNERLTGLIMAVGGAALLPPVLQRIRKCFPAVRSFWAVLLFAILLIPLAVLISRPLEPQGRVRDGLRAAAITKAERDEAAGHPERAKRRLTKFANDGDPMVDRLLNRTDDGEKADNVPAGSRGAKDLSASAPQDKTSDYAERIETYWLPEAKALPDNAPEDEAAIGKLLTQIDGLVLSIEDGERLSLNPAQKAARTKLIDSLIRKQIKLLPDLRRKYGVALDTKLFRDDVRADVHGTTLTLIGGVFARNANVADMQTALQPYLARLRFRKVIYRWSPYLSDGLSYGLKPPTDRVVARWNGTEFVQPKM